jgi:chaperonin GroEL (HSP60 family)
MATKKARSAGDARDEVLRGVDIVANAIRATLGLKGRDVVPDKSFGAPRINKGGVTVQKPHQSSAYAQRCHYLGAGKGWLRQKP